MATQFAINEPDSFNSPNVTYLYLPGSRPLFGLLQTPDDVVLGYGAIDFIGDHDYFDISLPSSIINSFGERAFFGTVTINVIANDGTPFDGVLTLYAGKSSTVVATGTSLGSGETFLQFDGGSTYSSYTLDLQDNGNDQTGGYTIFVNVAREFLYTPTAGSDAVTGNNNHNLLVGGGGNDTLIGLDGRDVLNGGPGADTLQGGADNDLYIYIDATDTVVEQPGAGNDTVWTREVSFTLGPNLENLLLVEGTAARDGIGNALDNVITGNAAHNGLVGGDGNDTLIGGLSDDAMFGGLGNDTYSVDNPNDLVGEPFGGGFDTVHSSLPAYVLADTLEALILDPGATWAVGNAGDNTLIGNGISNYLIGYGNDSLTGVGGDASNDTMIGGLGDDTYQLDSAGDEAIENAGEGSDLIISEAAAYTLPSNVEAMFLGGAGVWGFGNESDNTLAGSSDPNYLFGRGGNDYLNGGGGQDYLEGGEGADVFLFTCGQANGATVADFTPGQEPARLRRL